MSGNLSLLLKRKFWSISKEAIDVISEDTEGFEAVSLRARQLIRVMEVFKFRLILYHRLLYVYGVYIIVSSILLSYPLIISTK